MPELEVGGVVILGNRLDRWEGCEGCGMALDEDMGKRMEEWR